MRTPPVRRPVLPPWSKTECAECADPDGGTRVQVVRKTDHAGTIAARMIGNQLHGYRLTNFRPLRPGFVLMRLHSEVCEFATPATEQQPLF
jgi:hypothetical protein